MEPGINSTREEKLNYLKKALYKASGNRFIQSALEKYVLGSLYLMGIGSGGEVFTSGEQAIFDLLKQRIKPPYCIFDVGSNKGQFLQMIIDNMGADEYSIHCFEPGRAPFKTLFESFKNNPRLILNNLAIGKSSGEGVLYYNAVGSGLASLTKRKLDHYAIEFNESETVQITTLDSYCSKLGINHIHLLKIDIEGHELDALKGANEMLHDNSIDIITFEFGGCNIDTRSYFREYWYLFKGLKMRLFRITPSGYLYPIKKYREIYEQFRTTNFIAFNNDYPNNPPY